MNSALVCRALVQCARDARERGGLQGERQRRRQPPERGTIGCIESTGFLRRQCE